MHLAVEVCISLKFTWCWSAHIGTLQGNCVRQWAWEVRKWWTSSVVNFFEFCLSFVVKNLLKFCHIRGTPSSLGVIHGQWGGLRGFGNSESEESTSPSGRLLKWNWISVLVGGFCLWIFLDWNIGYYSPSSDNSFNAQKLHSSHPPTTIWYKPLHEPFEGTMI